MEVKRQKRKGPRQEGVGWRQKRSKKLKSKKLTETPYFRSIKQGDCSDFLGTALISVLFKSPEITFVL